MAAQPTMGKENVANGHEAGAAGPGRPGFDWRHAASIASCAARRHALQAAGASVNSAVGPAAAPAAGAHRLPAHRGQGLRGVGRSAGAAHAKPGRVDVVVAEGTTLTGTIKVPAGVRLVGSAGTRPVITSTLTLNGDGAGVMNCDLRRASRWPWARRIPK